MAEHQEGQEPNTTAEFTGNKFNGHRIPGMPNRTMCAVLQSQIWVMQGPDLPFRISCQWNTKECLLSCDGGGDWRFRFEDTRSTSKFWHVLLSAWSQRPESTSALKGQSEPLNLN